MYELIIIGSGPAGLSAAIYAGRGKVNAAVVGNLTKSRLAMAKSIENYFGLTKTSGKELLDIGTKQTKAFGTEIIENEVIGIKKNKLFDIELASGEKLQTKTIILATGVSSKSSGLENEKDFVGKGVSYCVACDGPFFKNKKIAVIGSGNYAAKEALDLLKFTKDITIVTNKQPLEMSEPLTAQLKKEGIKILEEKAVKINGDKLVESIQLEKGDAMKVSGIFVAVGIASTAEFATQLGISTKDGFISVDKNNKTDVEGIWAAGDCTGGSMQVATAIGEGANAALNVIGFLRGKTMSQWG